MGLVARFRGRAAALAVVTCASAGLVGCPTGAELENEERFKFPRDAPIPSGCEEPLPDTMLVGCDYPATLQTYCSRGGCHDRREPPAAGLSLVADTFLIGRILDVPATHASMPACPGNVRCDASMRTCDRCDRCPENALLIDRENPSESWILKKMEPFIPGTTTSNVNIGCGDTMPSLLTADTVRAYDDEDKRCLTDFFLYIAANTPNPTRWPCTIETLDSGTPDGGI